MQHIVHIITGLETGGAERSLANLILGDRSGTVRHSVCSLAGPGYFGPVLRAAGIRVTALGVQSAFGMPAAMLGLLRLVHDVRPDIIHGWMYHGALAATVAARAASGNPALAWNIRQSLPSLEAEKRGTRYVIRTLSKMHGRADALVYNSLLARHQHATIGFPDQAAVVIPNGFDTDRWTPDADARAAWRSALNIDDDALVLGFVGRHHPVKNIPVFLTAARTFLEARPNSHLLVAGEGIDAANPALSAMIAALPHGRAHFLGRRDDVERIMPAFDLFCLSSDAEAFPNVLGEAMACGLACVATDVGDCRIMLNGCGTIVPPRDAAALSRALLELATQNSDRRRAMGQAARDRIKQKFGLSASIGAYQALYASLTEVKR